MRYVLLLIAFVIAQRSDREASNLLANGSFEEGELANPNGMSLRAESTAIKGWVVGRHGLDWIGTYWQASAGGRSIDLDSGTILGDGPYDGSISQTFATTVGSQYLVTFDLSGNPDSEPKTKLLQVSAAGRAEVFRFNTSTSQTHAKMGYKRRSFKFTATATTTTLTFTSQSGTGAGPVIDDVVVTRFP